MCQLSLLYSTDAEILKSMIINAAVINPLKAKMAEKTGHVDGFGYFVNRGTLWKTSVPGYEINFSNISVSSNPVIQHVRKTTRGTISDENSHPFEFTHFIAAHNGTLHGKIIDEDKSDKTDSEKFMAYVDEIIDKEGLTVLEAFKAAYDDIDGGKFAFLVYDKDKDKFYVIRGEATLYVSYISDRDNNKIGIIVNTEEDSLKMQLYLLHAHYGIKYTEPKLLTANTVYELDEENILLVENKKIKITQKNITVYRGGKVVANHWEGNKSTNYDYWPKKSYPEEKHPLKLFYNKGDKIRSYSDHRYTPRIIYGLIIWALINGKNSIWDAKAYYDKGAIEADDLLINYSHPIILRENAASIKAELNDPNVIEFIRELKKEEK